MSDKPKSDSLFLIAVIFALSSMFLLWDINGASVLSVLQEDVESTTEYVYGYQYGGWLLLIVFLYPGLKLYMNEKINPLYVSILSIFPVIYSLVYLTINGSYQFESLWYQKGPFLYLTSGILLFYWILTRKKSNTKQG